MPHNTRSTSPQRGLHSQWMTLGEWPASLHGLWVVWAWLGGAGSRAGQVARKRARPPFAPDMTERLCIRWHVISGTSPTAIVDCNSWWLYDRSPSTLRCGGVARSYFSGGAKFSGLGKPTRLGTSGDARWGSDGKALRSWRLHDNNVGPTEFLTTR